MKAKSIIVAFGMALFCAAIVSCGAVWGQTKPQAKAAESAKIDLNKATPEQLGKCPGLTVALAKAIAEYRDKSGPFKVPEDLLKVKGISREILNKLNPKPDKGTIFVTPASDEDEDEPSLKPSKC